MKLKLKGYYLNMEGDDEAGGEFVIAKSVKDAKKIFIDKLDWLCDYDDWFLRMRIKWAKNAKIEGLNYRDTTEDISETELINRNIYSTIYYAQCPICKEQDVQISKVEDKICCYKCE